VELRRNKMPQPQSCRFAGHGYGIEAARTVYVQTDYLHNAARSVRHAGRLE
jgi:hypothetical protein